MDLDDGIAYVRAEFTEAFGPEVLRRAEEKFGVARLNWFLVEQFRSRTLERVEAVLAGSVDVPAMTEGKMLEFENVMLDGITKLIGLPELQGVPVAEALVWFQNEVFRSMRRTQRRTGAERRRTNASVRPDPMVDEFERRRQHHPKPDRTTARGVLAEFDPSWLQGSDATRDRKIEALVRRARRKRGHT